ncbi:hypothetical protein D3C76_1062160 [compost metagenome]
MENDGTANTKIPLISGVPWTRRQHYSVIFSNVQFIVPDGIFDYICANACHLIQILSDVLGEGIEVINQQYFHEDCPGAKH